MRARFSDHANNRRSFDRLQVIDFVLEGFEARLGHGYAFHGRRYPDIGKKDFYQPRLSARPIRNFAQLKVKYLPRL